MIKLKASVFILITTALDMRDFGRRISSIVRVKKPGLISRFIRGTISRGKSTAKASSSGQMVLFTMVIFMITTFRVTESTSGLMEECIVVIGRTTKCTARESLHGQMAENMKVNMLMTKKKVMAFLNGKKTYLCNKLT